MSPEAVTHLRRELERPEIPMHAAFEIPNRELRSHAVARRRVEQRTHRAVVHDWTTSERSRTYSDALPLSVTEATFVNEKL
jgi:hypothetical protein